MDARIKRLEELVSGLRCDIIKLQSAGQIAASNRKLSSFDVTEVLCDAVYAIATLFVGVLLGITLSLDPDRCSKSSLGVPPGVEADDDQAKS